MATSPGLSAPRLRLRQAMTMILAAVAALVAGLWGNDRFEQAGLVEVPAGSVLVQPSPSLDVRGRSVEALPPGFGLQDQFAHPFVPNRQFHFDLQDAALGGQPLDRSGVVVLVPAAGGPFTLFANRVPMGDSTPLGYFGPGLGLTAATILVPGKAVSGAEAAIDLVLTRDPHHAGVRSILIGSGRISDRAEEELAEWHSTLRGLAQLAAIVVVFTGLAGLAIGRNPLLYGGGLLTGIGLGIWLVSPLIHAWDGAQLLHACGQVLVIAGALICLLAGLRQATLWAAAVCGMAFAALAGGLLGGLMGWTSLSMPSPVLAAHLATTLHAPLALVALPGLLIGDIQALSSRMAANRIAMAQQAALIEQQDRSLQASVRDRAIAEERQRFVRDIHDGIGGQLLSLLTRVRMGRVGLDDVAAEIQDGLSDLRLVVDSLDTMGGDLEDALTTFQLRASQQLEAAGIALAWHQPDTLPACRPDPRHILNLYRIMQEALSNCVRHAGAATFAVTIAERAAGPGLVVVMADDGCGFDPVNGRRGQGLNSMAARAAAMRASLQFQPQSAAAGSRIMIDWPISAPG
jgi:signal transduction histidine kinase